MPYAHVWQVRRRTSSNSRVVRICMCAERFREPKAMPTRFWSRCSEVVGGYKCITNSCSVNQDHACPAYSPAYSYVVSQAKSAIQEMGR